MTRSLAALTILLSTVLGLFSATLSGAQTIGLQGKRSELQQPMTFKLRGDARSAFKTFKRKAEFYGAFYVNPNENVFGSYWAAHDVGTADLYARAVCTAKSATPEACILYARVLPRKYQASASDVTMSRAANKEFQEYTRLQNRGRAGAFAISASGAVGYSWAEYSRAAAEKEALRRCAKSARQIFKNAPTQLRPIFASPLQQGCRTIHFSE